MLVSRNGERPYIKFSHLFKGICDYLPEKEGIRGRALMNKRFV